MTSLTLDPGLSDLDLAGQVADGHEDALAVLYDRFAADVFRTALRIDADRATAEEVVQETFLVLWERAALFDPARGSLGAWLGTIARNRALDRLRGAGRRLRAAPMSRLSEGSEDEAAIVDWLIAAADPIAAAVPEPGPEQALVGREEAEAVVRALGALETDERTVILLAYRHGLSQSEIASHLRWPLGTVKSRSRRALGRLRETIEAAGALDAEARRREADRASAPDVARSVEVDPAARRLPVACCGAV